LRYKARVGHGLSTSLNASLTGQPAAYYEKSPATTGLFLCLLPGVCWVVLG
jgi:hypothetical protein